jgi:hypothetical protein
MPSLNISVSIIAAVAILMVMMVTVGSVVFLRRSSDKGLIVLSLMACVAALVFTPLERILPEQSGFYLLLLGLLPVLATIIATVVASTARLMQTRRWRSVPSLVLSVAAVGLMYFNSTTSWFWPYAKY